MEPTSVNRRQALVCVVQSRPTTMLATSSNPVTSTSWRRWILRTRCLISPGPPHLRRDRRRFPRASRLRRETGRRRRPAQSDRHEESLAGRRPQDLIDGTQGAEDGDAVRQPSPARRHDGVEPARPQAGHARGRRDFPLGGRGAIDRAKRGHAKRKEHDDGRDDRQRRRPGTGVVRTASTASGREATAVATRAGAWLAGQRRAQPSRSDVGPRLGMRDRDDQPWGDRGKQHDTVWRICGRVMGTSSPEGAARLP